MVVISPNLLGKQWPERELNGLVARETSDTTKVILPVWHNITAAEFGSTRQLSSIALRHCHPKALSTFKPKTF
jgi:hypothetical protein